MQSLFYQSDTSTALDRRLSNKGFVLVNEKECPIIGRVSMNITIIDVSKIANTTVGQEVIVTQINPENKNSIQNAAKLCNEPPYVYWEILLILPKDLP